MHDSSEKKRKGDDSTESAESLGRPPIQSWTSKQIPLDVRSNQRVCGVSNSKLHISVGNPSMIHGEINCTPDWYAILLIEHIVPFTPVRKRTDASRCSANQFQASQRHIDSGTMNLPLCTWNQQHSKMQLTASLVAMYYSTRLPTCSF